MLPLLFLWHHKKVSGALLVVVLLGWIIWPKPQQSVPTQKVTKSDLVQTVSVSGTVNAKRAANLTFPIGGKVVYVGAQKGDFVKQYQTIASLDQRTLADNVANAVKAAQNAQISLDATNDKNGDRILSDTGLSVDARRELETAMNTRDQATIAVDIQKVAQEQAILSSPLDGILTRADITTPGVTAAVTTTYAIVDPTSVVFDMDVDQSDIGKIKQGQQSTIVFDAYPTETLKENVSLIDFVSHTTTNGGNAFTVETSLPANSDYKYRVGMTADADIIINKKNDVITIPLSSLTPDNKVYVKTAKGFKKVAITLGLQNDTDTQVTSGLSVGDTIALDPTLAQKQEVK